MSTASIERLRAGLLMAVLAVSCRRAEIPAARLTTEPASLQIAHGRCESVRLRWSELRPVDRPVVFVHLHDGRNVVRTFDHPANWPWTPGSSWIEDVEICQSSLAPPLPPGRYLLRAGVYDARSGRRLPLRARGKEVAKNGYMIGDIESVAPRAHPSIRFRGQWSAVRREVMDRQVPAVRWLHGDGSIAIRGGSGLRLHLSLLLEHAPLRLTHRGVTYRLDRGRHTWHVALASGDEVIFFEPALRLNRRARTATIEQLAFHP
jgi:hypothetical protein